MPPISEKAHKVHDRFMKDHQKVKAIGDLITAAQLGNPGGDTVELSQEEGAQVLELLAADAKSASPQIIFRKAT